MGRRLGQELKKKEERHDSSEGAIGGEKFEERWERAGHGAPRLWQGRYESF